MTQPDQERRQGDRRLWADRRVDRDRRQAAASSYAGPERRVAQRRRGARRVPADRRHEMPG